MLKAIYLRARRGLHELLTLLTIKTPEKWHSPFFASVYVAIALGVSQGSAILFTRHIRQLS
jgi:hypothetical protein